MSPPPCPGWLFVAGAHPIVDTHSPELIREYKIRGLCPCHVETWCRDVSDNTPKWIEQRYSDEELVRYGFERYWDEFELEPVVLAEPDRIVRVTGQKVSEPLTIHPQLVPLSEMRLGSDSCYQYRVVWQHWDDPAENDQRLADVRKERLESVEK